MKKHFETVYEFQEAYPKKEQREKKLMKMSPEEIMHIARSCGNTTAGAYYAQFARLAEERDRTMGKE